jgi:hypothetical protein
VRRGGKTEAAWVGLLRESLVFVFHLCVLGQHGDNARRWCEEPEGCVGALGSKTAHNDDPGALATSIVSVGRLCPSMVRHEIRHDFDSEESVPHHGGHAITLVLLLRPGARDELRRGAASFLDSDEEGSPRRLLSQQRRAATAFFLTFEQRRW